MKKFTKKLKGKKVLSLVLAAIMLATTFNIALPMLKLNAEAADITIDGVSQTQIVTDTSVYNTYAANYLGGASYSTGIVIPGLDPAQDYVIQGMTYYPKRDWMLVTAYHNYDSKNDAAQSSSKVFALDAATGDFVAMFSFINVDGTTANVDHGGGIAVSEHNIYYSCGDKDRRIAYAPLSALENAPEGQHTQIQLVDSIDFVEVGSVSHNNKTAYTAYVCYDEGILWMGNFYDKGADLAGVTIAAADYNAPANDKYNSMVFGYKLAGNSSKEEWDYLKGKFKNLVNVTTASGTASANGSNLTWNAYKNGGSVGISGNITAPTAYVGEFTPTFGSVYLTEGKNYTIEFTSTNNSTDMYMFSPSGPHCNVKQSTQSEITQLEDGTYHYKMNFTAGLRPTGADSSWPTTQSTDGSYTGTYTIRFDQDGIQAGKSRVFAITDIKISETNTYENAAENVYDEGYAGSPSYSIGLSNNLKDVQYAVVDNGKLYLSRSYGSGAGNSISFGFGESSFLTVADIDLSVPGTEPVTISTTSTGSRDKTVMAYEINDYKDYAMMPMSEGLCVINDEIFITFEGASNKYLNESSGLTSIGNCDKPVDVIWQLDPYDLLDVEVAEAEKSIHYKKINSLSDIKNGKEYIIAYESNEVDPVTQKKILYAFDAYGNFKDYKLSKSDVSTVKGYNGMVGHAIKDYSLTADGTLYLNQPEIDDVENIRWTLNNVSGENYKITNTSTYFANCNNLYFDGSHITMAPGNAAYLGNTKITQLTSGNGKFYFDNGNYRLWCNDGVKNDYNDKINAYYANNAGSTTMYGGVVEKKGTIHCDAKNALGSNIIGGSIPDDGGAYNEGAFYIFERAVDEISSTYESRVYTGLDATLQADGTYTVTLETYAISPNHYQYRGVKPTDYIIVADTSNTMNNGDGTGLNAFVNNNSLSVGSLSIEANTSDDHGEGVCGYGFSNPEEEIYFKHTDGKYYKVYLAVNNIYKDVKDPIFGTVLYRTFDRQRYWAYYVADDGLYYVLQDTESGISGTVAGGVWPGITYNDFKYNVDNDINYSDYSTKGTNTERRKEDVYVGPHYRYDNVSHHPDGDQKFSRIASLKETTKDLIDAIAAENSQNRIALLQYGADNSTGYYSTSSGNLAKSGYTDAFWSASNAATLQGKVDGFAVSTQGSNDGIEFNNVNEIMSNSGADYKGADSDRNVAIILITDGVAGADGGSDPVSAANKVIQKALTAKQNGAFIYTALIGADGTSFERNKYLEAVSSKYAEAKSMTVRGGQSVDGINYNLSIATATLYNYLDFGPFALKETSMNNGVGLENLDVNSYLRGELTNVFMSFDESDVKVELVPGVFDKIGRFTFDEAKATTNHDVKHTVNSEERTITVTNYNYASEYIAKNKSTPGNKLKITISGLLLDPKADLSNRMVTNTDTTGIYKNDIEFKGSPTAYLNVNDYTYVLDYGLQMLDTDINGTVKSVSAGLTAQVDANGNLAYKDVSENGLLAIQEGNQNLLYHTTPTNMSDSGYVLKYVEETGKYEWFEIKIVPASNVYFEETEFEITDKGKVGWSTQTGGITATERNLPNEGDVDGYDASYDNNNTYSNGKTLFTTVNSTNKLSESAKVTFAGNGIDIISACGPTTGIQIIDIKDVDTGKYVAAAVVDTYYAGATYSQVPIFSWRGNYGNYIVETSAAYLSSSGVLNATNTTKGIKNNLIDTGLEMNTSTSFDENVLQAMLDEAGVEGIDAENVELIWHDDNSILNGGSGVAPTKKGARAGETKSVTLSNYLDGFRIYNPLGSDSSDYAESERGAVYYNVIDSLVDGPLSDGSLDFASGKVAFVTGNLKEGETLSFANYESIGPKNELYLQGGASTGVVFNTPVAAGGRVMVSLRAVNGTATATINGKVFTINSATEMYYDITELLDAKQIDTGKANVSITNTGVGILAVNNIKLTNAVATSGLMPLEMEDLETVQYYATMKPVDATVEDGVVTPVVEEEIPEDNTNTDNDNTNDGTNTEESDKEEFSIFSIIEMLIAFIEKILYNAFGAGSMV